MMRTAEDARLDQRLILSTFILPFASNVYTVDKGHWVCDCPAHQDARQSLTITFPLLDMRCKAGCSLYAICECFSVCAQTLFPHKLAELWIQQSDYVSADPKRLEEYYRSEMKAGLGKYLSPEGIKDYKQLATNNARKPKK